MRFHQKSPKYRVLDEQFVKLGLVVGHKKIKEAGLGKDESLLQFTENIHSIVSRASVLTKGELIRLSETISMYVILRQNAMTQQEAKEDLTQLIVAFYSI